MAFDRRKRSGGKREDSRRDGGKGRMSGRRGDASGKMSRKDNEKPLKECPDYTGTVQMTRDGFVFVKVEGMEDDIFVRNGKTKKPAFREEVTIKSEEYARITFYDDYGNKKALYIKKK